MSRLNEQIENARRAICPFAEHYTCEVCGNIKGGSCIYDKEARAAIRAFQKGSPRVRIASSRYDRFRQIQSLTITGGTLADVRLSSEHSLDPVVEDEK